MLMPLLAPEQVPDRVSKYWAEVAPVATGVTGTTLEMMQVVPVTVPVVMVALLPAKTPPVRSSVSSSDSPVVKEAVGFSLKVAVPLVAAAAVADE